jgi:hypothetical protein
MIKVVQAKLDELLCVLIEGKGVKDDIMNNIMHGSTHMRTIWDANFYKAIIKRLQVKGGLKKMEEFMTRGDDQL